MTIHDIPNIEHCDITMVGSSYYRIYAHEGWYIHMTDEEPGIDLETGEPTKIYKTVTILRVDGDFSIVEICAEADLPPNAEIHGGGNNNDHEVM